MVSTLSHLVPLWPTLRLYTCVTLCLLPGMVMTHPIPMDGIRPLAMRVRASVARARAIQIRIRVAPVTIKSPAHSVATYEYGVGNMRVSAKEQLRPLAYRVVRLYYIPSRPCTIESSVHGQRKTEPC